MGGGRVWGDTRSARWECMDLAANVYMRYWRAGASNGVYSWRGIAGPAVK